jgi:glycosyltransferase involved in cell wall biosynthesis
MELPVLKIAHFSTSQSGGAAVAANRLSHLLNSNGVYSRVYSRDDAQEFALGKTKEFLKKSMGKLNTRALQVVSKEKHGIVTPLSIGLLDVQKIVNSDYDIIHIHNWYNLFSLREIRLLSETFPIVFTLHDERIITGGCHITLGCDQFRESCQNCPALKVPHISLRKFKEDVRELVNPGASIAMICPSDWLLKKTIAGICSDNLKALAVIPNEVVVSTNLKRTSCVDISFDGMRLLFVAADLNSEVKGLQVLLEALSNFHLRTGSTKKIELTLIGSGKVKVVPSELVNFKQVGPIPSGTVHQFMHDSNFLIVPSLSENAPNVIAEAQLLGLPVIASRVSGIPEMVQDSRSGFLFEPNSDDLIHTFARAFSFTELHTLVNLAKVEAQKRHDSSEIFSKHLSIYSELTA